MAQLQTIYGISPPLVTVDDNLRLVSVEGNRRKFVMPSGEPNSSDRFIALTSTAGTPTNLSVPEGSLTFNAATKKPFFFDGTSWVQFDTTAGVDTWAATLASGNTSGGTNPTISGGDQVVFASGVHINGNGSTSGGAGALAVAIGEGAEANGSRGIAVGQGAIAAATDSIALGGGVSNTWARSAGILQAPSATDQIALGPATCEVSVLGTLNVAKDAAFHDGVVLDAMLSDIDTTNRLTIPTHTAPPAAAVADGSIMVETTGDAFYYRSGGAWFQVGPENGSVTSVDLSAPGEFTVSGNPVTTSGTLTLTKANQNANLLWAGPSGGAPAAPTFRSLVTADLPAGTGTVTSVDLSAPAEFTVSGNPVSTSGTLTIAKATQAANLVWAGPSAGGPLAPTFRSLVLADLPAIPAESWATTLAAGRFSSGTNPTLSNGDQVVFGQGIKINSSGATGGTYPTNFGSIGIGYQTQPTGDLCTAIGYQAIVGAGASDGTAVGSGAEVAAGHTQSSAFGSNAVTTSSWQVRVGTSGHIVSVPGFISCENEVRVPNMISVAVPNDANAAAAGVDVGGLYRGTSDPYQVYVRVA